MALEAIRLEGTYLLQDECWARRVNSAHVVQHPVLELKTKAVRTRRLKKIVSTQVLEM
jgi:hypothetical protein